MPFNDTMNTMLPPQNGTSPHVTGNYGKNRASGPHGGTDFNYQGGQTGVDMTNPTINSPISGTVTFVGGQYGTIKIRDADGNSREILHTNSQNVTVGQQVNAGIDVDKAAITKIESQGRIFLVMGGWHGCLFICQKGTD